MWYKQVQIAFADRYFAFNNLNFQFLRFKTKGSHQTCFADLSLCLTSSIF